MNRHCVRSVAKQAVIGVLMLVAIVGVGVSRAGAQECFIGEVNAFAFEFAPRNYMLAYAG